MSLARPATPRIEAERKNNQGDRAKPSHDGAEKWFDITGKWNSAAIQNARPPIGT
jgi:hypothetical protein